MECSYTGKACHFSAHRDSLSAKCFCVYITLEPDGGPMGTGGRCKAFTVFHTFIFLQVSLFPFVFKTRKAACISKVIDSLAVFFGTILFCFSLT